VDGVLEEVGCFGARNSDRLDYEVAVEEVEKASCCRVETAAVLLRHAVGAEQVEHLVVFQLLAALHLLLGDA